MFAWMQYIRVLSVHSNKCVIESIVMLKLESVLFAEFLVYLAIVSTFTITNFIIVSYPKS